MAHTISAKKSFMFIFQKTPNKCFCILDKMLLLGNSVIYAEKIFLFSELIIGLMRKLVNVKVIRAPILNDSFSNYFIFV